MEHCGCSARHRAVGNVVHRTPRECGRLPRAAAFPARGANPSDPRVACLGPGEVDTDRLDDQPAAAARAASRAIASTELPGASEIIAARHRLRLNITE